jgi:ribose transport system ATP-binding protein
MGEFFIDGRQVEIGSPADAKRHGFVLAHQNLSLIPDLPVWQNVCMGNERKRNPFFLDNKAAKGAAARILDELVPGEIPLEASVSDLSPAHRQMVEVAKALAQRPRVLILDEPTAALEYFHVEQLFRKIEELKRGGVSVVFISHRLWEITRMCDRVIVFRNGETVGTVDFERQARDEDLIVPLVTGQAAGDQIDFVKKTKKDFEKAETVLELDGVQYRDKLKSVSFSVRRGELLGIGGLHGQGQEELIMVLAGSICAGGGEVRLDGKPLRCTHPKQAIRRGVYLVPGDRMTEGLFWIHNVFSNLIFPRFSLRMDGMLLKFTKLFSVADGIIEKVALAPPNRAMTVNTLSGGNQQKTVFGRWLQFQPRVLLLNDPAKGIDIAARNALYRLTHELTERGTSVILYASSNEELISNCDRVLIMFEGRIVEEILHEDISDEKLITSSLRVGVSK